MAREPIHEDGTLITERKTRSTGTRVQLVYNYGGDPEQPWETICVDHGGVCSHQSRPLAASWLSHPEEWCEDCMYGEGTLAGKPVEGSPVDVVEPKVACAKCGSDVHPLAVFPGGMCLECYRPIGEAEMSSMTPERLAGMFGSGLLSSHKA